MSKHEVFVGLDISKGTAEVCIKDNSARILHEGTFDGTPNGHNRLISEINLAIKNVKANSIQICMESTGGLERNWFRSLKTFAEQNKIEIEVHVINPLLIHGFVREKLHGSSTDVSAARDIAEYLRLGRPLPKLNSGEVLLDGTINLYRMIQNSVERYSKLKNELQSLIPQVRPELGKYMRSSIPVWVLIFLQKYPTVNCLARIKAQTLVKIPGITEARAKELLEASKNSIAAYRDDMTGLAVENLAEDILTLEKKIEKLRKALSLHVGEHDLVQRLASIPGMAEWTAIGLIVELGDIRRFSRVEQVVAYAGLDPVYHQSGDGVSHSKISRRGKSVIRKLLYMPAQTAAMHNPVIKEFYNRLRGGGKTHRDALTACMGKMLKIAYALWVTGKTFDAEYAKNKAADQQQKLDPKLNIPGKPAVANTAWDEDAPISRREAQRRKRLQTEKKQRIKGIVEESPKRICTEKCSQPGIDTRSKPQIQQAKSDNKLSKNQVKQAPKTASRTPLKNIKGPA